MTVRSLITRPLATAAAVAFAILSFSAFSHVGSSTTASRVSSLPVADVAMVTPLATPSAPRPANGGKASHKSSHKGAGKGSANRTPQGVRHAPGGQHKK